MILSFFIIYCILFPKDVAIFTAKGLSLWYNNVVPTLLPFSILSYIIIQSDMYHAFFSRIGRIARGPFHRQPQLLYPILFGFLLGFPIGARLMADLYENGQLSKSYFTAYTCACNNFGPAFILTYIGKSQLNDRLPSWILFVSIYLPSILLLFFLLRKTADRASNKKPASRSYMNFKIIDTGIINGFETMLRIAGYIVLFSILAGMIQTFPGQHSGLKSLVTGLLEVTTGVAGIAVSHISLQNTYALTAGIVSFGGLCGLFQTRALMKNCPFHTLYYTLLKVCCAVGSISLCLILIRFLT